MHTADSFELLSFLRRQCESRARRVPTTQMQFSATLCSLSVGERSVKQEFKQNFIRYLPHNPWERGQSLYILREPFLCRCHADCETRHETRTSSEVLVCVVSSNTNREVTDRSVANRCSSRSDEHQIMSLLSWITWCPFTSPTGQSARCPLTIQSEEVVWAVWSGCKSFRKKNTLQ